MEGPDNDERTLTLGEFHARGLNMHLNFCIQYPHLDVDFELKYELIRLLPTFRGSPDEDPLKHLKEFQVVCVTMKPATISEEQTKLRPFPFSLAGKHKDWLYYLLLGFINTWDELKRLFLHKYFPLWRTDKIRKDISHVMQYDRESLYEYWERFQKLSASYPNHAITDSLLIRYFYEGLLPNQRSSNGGEAVLFMAPEAARTLIVAAKSQQFGVPQDPVPLNKVKEASASNTEENILNPISRLLDAHIRLQQETRASIQSMENRILQLATSINELRGGVGPTR